MAARIIYCSYKEKQDFDHSLELNGETNDRDFMMFENESPSYTPHFRSWCTVISSDFLWLHQINVLSL